MSEIVIGRRRVTAWLTRFGLFLCAWNPGIALGSRGIRIATTPGRDVVTGICEVPDLKPGLHLVLVAIDPNNKKIHAGAIRAKASFEFRLDRDLGLPEGEADYDVHAVLGSYKSNVVHLKARGTA